MAKKNIKRRFKIDGHEIAISYIEDSDFISLTDMANWDNDPNAKTRIRNWLKNGATIRYLAIWEKHRNPNFNYAQLDVIKMRLTENAYIISPKTWIEETGAIGIKAKAGRYGGTYAHKDIAFEFASWLSPEFKFFLLDDYQRLKEEEAERNNREWDAHRFLSKVNYKLHTDTIKDFILPALHAPKNREWIIYAEEADLLNMAVFNMTAKQWREQNPEKATQGNMRDFTDFSTLHLLSNLEVLNSAYIAQGMGKEERFEILRQEAIRQYKSLLSISDKMKRLE